MNNSLAQRLLAAARLTGGSITTEVASESDIAHGRADGWLTSAGIGQFRATDKLRQVGVLTMAKPAKEPLLPQP